MNCSTKIALIMAMAVCSCSRTPAPTEAATTRVKIEVARQTSQQAARSYSGTIEESSGTVLSFSVGGTVRQVHVDLGQQVSSGQLIASLDDSNLRHAYDIAAATLNQAQDAYNRMEQLHQANALPEIRWIEVQSTLEQARSAAAIARKALDDANLYATAPGYVSEKMAEPGMNVAPGVPVVKVVDISSVKAIISVPENEIAGISGSESATVTVGAIGGRSFAGSLSERGVAANPLSRAYSVKFDVPNPARELLPGMICEVAVTSGPVATIVSLPSDAVLLDADNRNFVWTVNNGRAQKRLVTTEGMTAGTRIVIGSGLAAGDSVIVSGQQKVSEGTSVVNIPE